MFEALKTRVKRAEAKASDVSFLATLIAEHSAVGARAQLKTLWIGQVSALLLEDEEAPVESWGGGSGGGGIRAAL